MFYFFGLSVLRSRGRLFFKNLSSRLDLSSLLKILTSEINLQSLKDTVYSNTNDTLHCCYSRISRLLLSLTLWNIWIDIFYQLRTQSTWIYTFLNRGTWKQVPFIPSSFLPKANTSHIHVIKSYQNRFFTCNNELIK